MRFACPSYQAPPLDFDLSMTQIARMRIAMGVEYDGSGFRGWQVQQKGVRTVQHCVAGAISKVADHPVTVHCAGRTDAGVHAFEQVIHFDTTAIRPERAWRLGTNVNLPPDIAIRWVLPVGDEFHARFKAEARHYRYRILRRPTRSALLRNQATWVHQALDVTAMRTAAESLVGEHDFTSFRAVACQAKSPVRRIRYLDLVEQQEFLEIRVGANGFLHHMVRNIAGVLISIGKGEAPVDWTSELLRIRDRTRAGATAPASGLYFVRADYPAHFGLEKVQTSISDSG